MFLINPNKPARRSCRKASGLIADPAKAKKFGEAGRKRVEDTFAWSAPADQTIDLYQKLIGTP